MEQNELDYKSKARYTKGEEIFNMSSHIVGAVFGIIAMVLCIIIAAIHKNTYGIVSGIIYGTTMTILYTISSIYHGLSPKLRGKDVLRVLDHCSIFLLIAGSYTPFSLCTLREYDSATGWVIFSVVWILAFIGITLNAIDLNRYKVFSMICYLLMGWCIIVKASILPQLLTIPGFILLLAGGIVYTIGAVLYGIGKKHRYIHSVFHLFILAASILQFLTIILYVM